MTVGERAVRVRDKLYFVRISQTPKRTWVAAGDYMGKRIEVMGSSANNAARRWVTAAQGNGQSEHVAET
jgi:hypothetical protein